MADQLEEIKAKIDIVGFISEYLPLKKAGRNFKALCPFHTEKTPSFIISPERQIWHCFGCGRGGDQFGFLMQIENLEFPEALEILAKRAGVKLVTSYQASESAKLKDKIFKINHLASEFYHYLLLNHPSGKKALDYVLGRGVNKKSIETFKLGWAPNLWDALSKFLLKKGFNLPEIETAGLVIKRERQEIPKPIQQAQGRQVRNDERGYYDRFRGRLMFALRDYRGNVIGFAGRTLDPNATEAKYINTPETPVYIKGNVLYGLDITKEAIKKEDKAIVVEGEFDLISSFQAGVSHVVAIKGSALTEGQVSLLKRFTQNIDLALDMDLAGDAASRRGIEVADAAGFSIRMIQLPQGKDPDECARINPLLWQKAVKNALSVFDYILDSALARFGKETAEGKKKIGDEVIPVLAKIASPIVQAHYLAQLASLLNVSEEVIVQTAKKFAKQEEIGQTAVAKTLMPSAPAPRQQLLEEQLLAMILQSATVEETVKIKELEEIEKFLTVPAIKKIFSLLLKYFTEMGQKKFKISEFVKTLPAELGPTVDRLYLVDLGNILENQKLLTRELEKTTVEIKKIFLKNRLLSLSQKLKEADKKDIETLTKEYRETAAELKKYQANE